MQALRLMLKIKMALLLCIMQQHANNSNPDVVKALVNAGAEVTQAIIEAANDNENINQSTIINLLEHAIKKK